MKKLNKKPAYWVEVHEDEIFLKGRNKFHMSNCCNNYIPRTARQQGKRLAAALGIDYREVR